MKTSFVIDEVRRLAELWDACKQPAAAMFKRTQQWMATEGKEQDREAIQAIGQSTSDDDGTSRDR